ncbi:MAG: glycoside hydrolase family 57 protein [Planctomycetes bacterium]|nr:glycoside hydrolase family 57 protein [Planctomycetota bacterium]
MVDVVFYFQVHQPYRLKHLSFRDENGDPEWFDDAENQRIFERVAERCYLPMNAVLRELIDTTDGRFKCSFSISGTALEQMKAWSAETVDSFVDLAETGCVEFLSETSMHSLLFDIDPDEFERQVRDHRAAIADLFGREPTTFRNTECVIDESIARRIEDMGFLALVGEGADQLLGMRSPLYVYRPHGCWRLRLLLRCYPFSDDIGFRFSNRKWPEYPLYADKFAGWLHEVPERSQFIGLYMDYETFGEHQWTETGIFEFMRHLPEHVLADERFGFATPTEVVRKYEPIGDLSIPRPISWADEERDLTAWRGNPMQRFATQKLVELGPPARLAAAMGAPELLAAWRKMTTSDHTYYMSTKFSSDGDVHEYFSPYPGPREAFLNFMDALDDLAGCIDEVIHAERSEVTE